MVKITVSADCGNAPRKLFLADFNKALAHGDRAFIEQFVEDDITWEVVGARRLTGKADVAPALAQVGQRLAELTVSIIITHGKDAAVNGERHYENGATYSFCDIYTFKGAAGSTIRSITSYVIKVG